LRPQSHPAARHNATCLRGRQWKDCRGRRLDVLGFLYSLMLAGLGLLGMTGIVYHALAPNGLFTG
jgi:hypothetical protein